MTRKESYEKKRSETSKRCITCRKSLYPPTPERCEECTTGRRLRMLEAEYSDVTGWSHDKWKTQKGEN